MGNHWGCISDDFEEIFSHVVTRAFDEPTFVCAGRIRPAPKDPKTIFIGNGLGEDLAAIVVQQLDSVEKVLSVKTAYPFALAGVTTPLEIAQINEWDNGIEAVIEAALPDEAFIAFFDPLYFKNKHAYVIGKTYDVEIGCLAYSLKPGVAEVMRTTNQETLAKLHEALGDDFAPNADGVYEPIERSTEGMSGFLPDEGHPDDATFMGTISDVVMTEFEGVPVFKSVVSIAGVGDEELALPVYATELALPEGYEPKAGDWVQGVGWITGYLVGTIDEPLTEDDHLEEQVKPEPSPARGLLSRASGIFSRRR